MDAALRTARRALTASLVLLALTATSAQAAWPSTGLPIATDAGVQTLTDLVPDGAGGAYVAWFDEPTSKRHLVRVTAAGNVADGWSATGLVFQGLPWLGACPDGAGGVLLFMMGEIVPAPTPGTWSREVKAWRVRSDGTLAGGWSQGGQTLLHEERGSSDPDHFESLTLAGLLPDDGGGAFVALHFRLPRSYDGGVHVVRVRGTGALGASWDLAQAGTYRGIRLPMEPDGADGLFMAVLWGSEITVRHYDAGGALLSQWDCDNDSWSIDELRLVRLRPGTDFAVSWVRWLSEFMWLEAYDVRLDTALQPRPGWMPSQQSTWYATMPDRLGGAFGVRPPFYPNTHSVQRMSFASCPPSPLWATPHPLAVGDLLEPDGDRGFFHLGFSTGGGYRRLSAQHVAVDGAPAAGWPVAGVELASLVPAGGDAARVVCVGDGAAIAAWSDARAGDTDVYARRLDEHILAPVSVPPGDAPGVPPFALTGFATNPVRGEATVVFRLSDATPATLTLHDVAGRVVARHEVGSLGTGTHRVVLAEARALSPGVVFARLERAGEWRTARAVVMR